MARRTDPAQAKIPGVRQPRRRYADAERLARADLAALHAADALVPDATLVELGYVLLARAMHRADLAEADYQVTTAVKAARETHAYLTGRAEAPPTDLDPFAIAPAVIDPTFT